MATTGKGTNNNLQREASPGLIIGAVVLVAIALLAGGFYAYNGGWKTQSQLEEEGKHTSVPLRAAMHGDMGPLEAENKLRKEHGEPLLEIPKDRAQKAADSAGDLAKLRQQIEAKQQGQQPGTQ